MHVPISLVNKFQLKLTILIFWNKFAQKEEFRLETKNVNITIEFSIFELVLAEISAWTDNFEFLDQVCSKRVFSV